MRLWKVATGGGLDFQGTWDAGTTYYLGQTVSAGGGLYVALGTSTGVDPTTPSYGPPGVQGSAFPVSYNLGTAAWITQEFTTDSDVYVTDLTGFVQFGPGGAFGITDTRDGTVLFTATTTAAAPGGQGANITAPVTVPGVLPAGTYWVVLDRGAAATGLVTGSNQPDILGGSVSAVGLVYTGVANGVHATPLAASIHIGFSITGKAVLPSAQWDLAVQGI